LKPLYPVEVSDYASYTASGVKVAYVNPFKQNIAFALAVNIIGIVLSSQGLISPLAASIIHESNALIVMANSLRLLKVK
jgi:cation transport ATPase